MLCAFLKQLFLYLAARLKQLVKKYMKIAIVGTGYVGLVTGTCFAETGNTVTCVDIDLEKVEKLKSGQLTIYEPGLEQLFERNLEQGRLKFTAGLEEGIKDAQFIFLALPTPPGADGAADMSYVKGVAEQLGPILKNYTIIVDKSTVPVGTAEMVRDKILKNATAEFDVVSNPEFLREGAAVEDFMKPERVVIGAQTERAKKLMERLYAPFVRQGNPLVFVDVRSAEMIKYAANSFLAMKISFMNEIANLCSAVGADVDAVRKGIGTDSRIGKRFLFSGIGYGGSCFPKDVQALYKTSQEANYDFKILRAVMEVNAKQKTILLPQIKDFYKGQLKGKVFAFWGLTFKPDTDDIREAPSLENIEALLKEGAVIKAHDPEGAKNVRQILGDQIQYCKDPYLAAENADAIFIATEWPEFRALDFEKLEACLKTKVIFDGRNLYDIAAMKELGYTYFSIGRETIYG